MGLLDGFGRMAAEQALRTLGPAAGVRAYRSLVDSGGPSEEQARAVLGGIEAARLAGDEEAFRFFVERWRQQPGTWVAEVARCCGRILSARPELAQRLADAEVERSPEDPRAWYLRARCGGPRAEEDLRRAADLAQRPPAQPSLLPRIRARLARLTGEAKGVDLAALPVRERLPVLAAKLRAKGRYGRVSALDALREIAEGGGPYAGLAVRLAARHADVEGRLTELERDRVAAILGAWPDTEERRVARARLEALGGSQNAEDSETAAALRRARAVLERGSAGPAPSPPTSSWRALDAIVALLHGTGAADRYESLLDAVSPDAPVSAPLLTATWLGRRAKDRAVARVCEELAARLCDAPPPYPPQGWLRLSDAVKDPLTRERLLRRAWELEEPGASERLGEAARAAGWEAWRRGDPETAYEALHRARRLYGA